jgi:hypothetical protein
MIHSCRQRCAPIFLLLSALLAPAYGQRFLDGSVTGVVTDRSQAIIIGAAVDLRNLSTGVVTTSVSNDAGVFNFPSTPIGTYELRVSKDGFKAYVASNITVETSQTVRIDAALDIGSTQESVTVTASAPLLSKETSDLGTEVTRDVITNLPFQMASGVRVAFSFVKITPGATGSGGAADGTQIAGSRMYANENYVDGAPADYNPTQNVPGPAIPPLETVSEFRVETAVAPAEYGRTMGGAVLLVTRSGTNRVHGNLFSLFRNNVLDARTFNTAAANIERQGEFGVTLGGPVFLPSLYDGRNRTFFFANYSGFRGFTNTSGQTGTVATAQERTGDFSQVAQRIFDPASAGAGGQLAQFPGNMIPASRISPFAAKMQSYWPLPNAPGTASNFIGGLPLPNNTDMFSMKIDNSFGSRNRVSGSYRQRNDTRAIAPNGFISPASDLDSQILHIKFAVIADDLIIRPNLVNHVQGSVNRFSGPVVESQNLGVGVPGAFASGYPGVRFSGQGFAGFGYQNTRTTSNANRDYQEALAWTTGAHNAKFGARLAQFAYSLNQPGFLAGYYTFSQFATSQPQVAGTGNSYASFLLGLVNNAQMTKNTPYTIRSNYLGLFAQDDWKITRRLTVNYGYRYEFQTPFGEMNNSMSTMNPNTPNPGAGGRPGAVIFAGKGPGRSGYSNFMDTYYAAHAPRLGLAYQLGRNTVIRAGAGLFYAPLSGLTITTTGFTASNTIASLNGGLTPAFQIDKGWPAGLVHEPPFIDPTISNGQNTTTTQWSSGGSDRLARTSQWQFSIQHSIRSVLVEADYVGTVGHGLNNNGLVNINQLPPETLALGSLLTRNITDPAVVAAGYRPPYAGFTGTLAQALRPFPQYLTITTQEAPTGNSSYHALYLKSERRLSHGLQYLVAYQITKCLSDVTFINTEVPVQDQYNRRAQKGLCNTDTPQRLTTSFTYELPAGPGKPFFRQGVAGHILGGWSISGVLTYQGGDPLSVTIPNNLPLFNSQLRPNRVAGVPIYISPGRGSFQPLNALTGQQGDRYLNSAAFGTPAPFTFGNLGTFLPTVRGPGSENEDLSLVRRFRLHESWRAELRGDFFNVFNRRNLNDPVTDLTSASFGKITGQSSARVAQLGFRVDF